MLPFAPSVRQPGLSRTEYHRFAQAGREFWDNNLLIQVSAPYG